MDIKIAEGAENHCIKYLNQSIQFQSIRKSAFARIHVSLFTLENIKIFKNGKMIGEVIVKFNSKKYRGKNNILIDYSCARYNVSVEGIKDEIISLGCQVLREATKNPILEIIWSATNYRLADKSLPAYNVKLIKKYPAKTTLINRKGEKRVITINASVPKHFYKLKLAMGFGPYMFKTSKNNIKLDSRVAPTFMLYGNMYFTQLTSIRFFESLTVNKSMFSNLGVYFAYQVGEAFDNRLLIIPLLGFQQLTFKQDLIDKYDNHFIYPQGFEAVYKHATMWGLSIGLPLASFF